MDPLTVAIYKRLTGDKELCPVLVDVKDTSGGCGQMFTVTIVSEAFRDMRPLQRHRKVNEILVNEIKELHAIILLLFSVSQYQAKNPKWVLPANATRGNDSATTSKGGGDQSTAAVDKVSPPPLSDNAQAKNPKCASPANATRGDGSAIAPSKDGGDQSMTAVDKVSPPPVSDKSQAVKIQM
ncbi:hypothetical protein H4S07_004322 [Coemansia furcata]|uniref:Uncharacterized protein n=1 Tax=Coemansia furcata TaxID=417177 RepID=A0ACC1LB56_9FUNG|nr:hypothetical protein H4S07_004322 [Coemansia furcata]